MSRPVQVLGTVGYVAKGLALVIIGLLFGWAAWSYNPERAGGLDAALSTVRGQPFGSVLLLAMAAGLRLFRAVLLRLGQERQALSWALEAGIRRQRSDQLRRRDPVPRGHLDQSTQGGVVEFVDGGQLGVPHQSSRALQQTRRDPGAQRRSRTRRPGAG